MLPRGTEKPTYTTAFRHENERSIPCTDDDGALTIVEATNVLNMKYIKSTALNCLKVAEDVSSWMVATVVHRCLQLDGQSLDPRKHNAGICPYNGNAENQCGLSAVFGQQYSCTELVLVLKTASKAQPMILNKVTHRWIDCYSL